MCNARDGRSWPDPAPREGPGRGSPGAPTAPPGQSRPDSGAASGPPPLWRKHGTSFAVCFAMGLPRPEQVRHELSEMARVYALVLLILVLGVVVMRFGGAGGGIIQPAAEVVGPF